MPRDMPSEGPNDRPNGTRISNGHSHTGSLDVLAHVLRVRPGVALDVLTLSKAAHKIAAAHLYHDLDVEIALAGTLGQASGGSDALQRACCPAPRQRLKVFSALRSFKYASYVRVLRFRHPCPTHAPSAAINDVTRESDRIEAWALASPLIAHCPLVEQVTWETGFGVNDELWTTISELKHLRRLHLTYPPPHPANATPSQYPRLTPVLQQVGPRGGENGFPVENLEARAIGREGLALGTAWEDLEELRLEGLSMQGAWTIASHLELLAELHDSHQPPRLHTLSLSTHFLDLRLCRAVANFGSLRSLKHITLSTTGTKLNAECLKDLLNECSVLQSLKLTDIEGRLDKNTWGMIGCWPSTFNSLELEIPENGSRHSWVVNHLSSIAEVPVGQLKRFVVRRVVHPIAILPFPPMGVLVPQPDATHKKDPIPSDLLDLVRNEGALLEDLCLDWWDISGPAMEAILLECPRLRKLQVSVRATVLDIIGMTTAFGNVPDLAELNITTDPKLATHAAIKVKAPKKKASVDSKLPPFLSEKVAESDPALVEVRDLRKFARRLPEFRVLRWMGRQGKGEWRFIANSKKTTLSPVDFIHSAVLTKDIWAQCQLEPASFQFADDISGSPQQLHMPVSPERPPSSEFPALSRSTTASSLLQSPTTPVAPISIPAMRRSSSSTSANTNPLGLEWDPFPPTAKVSPPTNSTRKLSSAASSPGRVDSSPPKVNENRHRPRNRRELKPSLCIGPPSPNKEPRHVPGSAPKKQVTLSNSNKAERDAKRDKEAKARRGEMDEGWTTVGNDRGRKK
ncbi:uncharacterized protein CcaverHIS019_0700860 [Cutaneotrichosporon cavernicola]|uniref:RNI-like protein n=1 Tax=Cutaneotrichosporon cavernicola TaxID=279322 RepID=A0AA48QYC1_9TREE|nr:uncharacterized protein CcaverHIS019_0700860 [Cutaneotrichosporon cavernicola]BEI94514.1 hypothetical protein CcaverHIS019_0700860 [Cutaneotrichosporon cavernicola]